MNLDIEVGSGTLDSVEDDYDGGSTDYFIEMTLDGTTFRSDTITASATNTAAEYATALNGNSDFSASFTASSSVVATAVAEVFTITMTGTAAAGAAAGDVLTFTDGTTTINSAALGATPTDNDAAAALNTAINANANFSSTVAGAVITVTRATAGAFDESNYAITNTTNSGNVASAVAVTTQGEDAQDTIVIENKETGTANASTFTNIGFRHIDQALGTVTAAAYAGVTSLANTGATNNETNGRDNSAAGNNKDAAATNTLNGNFGARDNDASFVNGAKNTITLQEANVVKFGTDAMSSSMQTYMATQGQTGGTFSLSGADVEFFEVNANSGLVQNKQNMDFETKQSYAISVTYTDKNGQTFTDEVTLNLTDNTADNVQHIADVDMSTQGGAASAISILMLPLTRFLVHKRNWVRFRTGWSITLTTCLCLMLTETSRGRIVDADFARETSELSKQQILAQAATSMLAQANQSKQVYWHCFSKLKNFIKTKRALPRGRPFLCDFSKPSIKAVCHSCCGYIINPEAMTR